MRLKTDPDGRRSIKTASPYLGANSSLTSSAISRLSPNRKSPPTTGTRRHEPSEGLPCVVQTTKPTSTVTLSTKPYSLACAPSAVTRNANTGIDSTISFFMRRPASSQEITFLLIAKECGVETAIHFAKQLGLKYKYALSHLRRQQL